MVSSVRSRPNHYETLGLGPGASDEAIRAAFARLMSAFRWHPAGSTAQLCIAYETLRDPARRRAYDLSLGIIPKSAPRQWGFAVTPQRWAPFIAAPLPGIAEAAAPAPEPHVEREPEPAAPRVASFIAASLRDLARPMAAEPVPQRPAPDEAALERHIRQVLTDGPAREADAPDERTFDWRRPALGVGGFVLAAGLIGTFAGLSVRDDAQSAQAEPVAAIGRPAVKPQAVAEAAVPQVAAADTHAERPAATRPRHTRKALPDWAEPQVKPAVEALAGDQIAQAAAEPLAEDPLAPQPVAAKLPLSDAVVARTIDRIGYDCGSVASTAAEGASGFAVTCTSGQTFHARKVRGRYRFSRH